MVTLKIDEKQITTTAGMTIIEAAKSIGIEIPHFCYHPKLSLSGSCRMCLVEIEGMPKLVTSCTTPVSDNMVVYTRSDMVKKAQEDILALLLINHPLDCPICDKGGECPLQDYTYKYGPGKSEFYDKKWHFEKPVNLSPLIVLDRERCILCTRCVRFQDEVAVQPELIVVEKGYGAYIETTKEEGFTSNFSGNTIELCPVGALTSRQYRFKARPWGIKRVPSVCPHCGCGCNIHIDVRENKMVRLLARENRDVDNGWLCDRGRFGYLFTSSPDRLKTPMIRKDNELVPCTWDEAISKAAGIINKYKEMHSIDSTAGLASPQLTNEELYIFQKFMREVVGTNSIDHSLERYLMIEPQGKTICNGLRRFSFSDIDEADVIVLIGGDPSADLPILDLRIKKGVNRGAKLYIAGTDEIELCRFAGRHIKAFESYPDLMDTIMRETGEKNKYLVLLNRMMHEEDVETICACMKTYLSGKISMGGWISLGLMLPEANSQGAQDMGVTPFYLPGYKDTGEGSLKGYGVPDKVKCLFLADMEVPDIAGRRRDIDHLISYTPFLNDTARLADVVFPAAVFSETDGTYTNSERRVQRLFKAATPPGEARSLWYLLMSIANALGADWAYGSSQDIMTEISKVNHLYRFITYETIGQGGSYADGTADGARYYS